MNAKFVDQAFRMLFILAFVLGMIGVPDTNAAAQEDPNPTFHVMIDATNRHGRRDWVDGQGWTIGQPLNITIDDPDTTINPDASLENVPVTECGWQPGMSCFNANFQGLHDIRAGNLVTVVQGSTVKTHEVLAVAITGADPETDVVNGIADPFSQVQVQAWNDINLAERQVVADGSGNWAVDFTDSDPETEDLELAAGMYLGVSRFDDDGDSTGFGDGLPSPNIHASAQYDWVRAREWPVGTALQLFVNNVYSGGVTVEQPEPGNDTSARFNLGDADLQVGDEIKVVGGSAVRILSLSSIAVSEVNTTTDTILGMGTPGAQAYVSVQQDEDYIWRGITPAEGTGAWEMYFGDMFDLQSGSQGSVQERDADGDSTWFEWSVPTPSISAFPVADNINGHNWPLGAPLQIEIDDPATPANPDYTGQASDWDPNVNSFQMIDFSGQYDMKPGDIVTVTNGTITKTHIVTELSITEIDVDTDIVSGLAEPGNWIGSWTCDQYGCAERWAITDQDGNWSANFSVLGNYSADRGTYDFTPGTGVEASQEDEDGDKTVVGMDVPNPHIQASSLDWVRAIGWPSGAEVHLTINGQDFGSATVDADEAFFNLGSYEIKIGDLIKVTDGVREKSLLFTFLMVTRIDRDMDILYGVGSPGALVYASASDIWLSTTADSITGAWEVDFSGVVDIQTDTEVRAEQPDEDGDSVWFDWQERPIWIEATPEDDTIYGWDWPYGALVTIEVNDPSTPINPDHIESTTVGPSPWGSTWFVITLQDYDLKSGDIVTVSDGTTTMITIVGDMDADGITDDIDNAPSIFNPDQRDVDSDNTADVLDPCPDDAANACDQTGSVANVIGEEGGMIATPSSKASLNIPASSVHEYISFTITDMGGSYELASDQGPMYVVQSYSIQPHGTQFDPPAIITIRWEDANDDGIVDGTMEQESDLRLIKDGFSITPACSSNPNCNVAANELTVQVSDLSLFALAVPVEWTLTGFYQPVDMNGVYNLVKGGSTVPLKFEIFAGSNELTDTAYIKGLIYAQTSCDADMITDAIETTVTGGTSLRYDSASGQFIYNWKTPKTAGKCYRVTMITIDDSSLAAYFRLK